MWFVFYKTIDLWVLNEYYSGWKLYLHFSNRVLNFKMKTYKFVILTETSDWRLTEQGKSQNILTAGILSEYGKSVLMRS